MATRSPGQRNRLWSQCSRGGLAWTPVFFPLVLMVGACNPAVSVNTKLFVPVPTIDPLPMDVAVRFDESMSLVALENKIVDLGKFKFDIGASAIGAFETIFDSMFRTVYRVDDSSKIPNGADGTLVLRIVDVQLTVPGQGGTDSFEVWFKYEMEVTDHEGALVDIWSFTSWGRASHDDTKRVNLFNPATVLERALEIAVRDAGALVALYFDQQPKIRAWIDSIK